MIIIYYIINIILLLYTGNYAAYFNDIIADDNICPA
jgi:hypothetical protein